MEKYDDRIKKLEAERKRHVEAATEFMKHGKFNAAFNEQQAADRAVSRIEKLKRQRDSTLPRCETCQWYEVFSGACCNGSSPHAADFRMKDDKCDQWEGT